MTWTIGFLLGWICGLLMGALLMSHRLRRPAPKPKLIQLADLPAGAQVFSAEVRSGEGGLSVHDRGTGKEFTFAGVNAAQVHIALNGRPDGLAKVAFVLDGVPVASEECVPCP